MKSQRARAATPGEGTPAAAEAHVDARPAPGVEFEDIIGSPAAPRARSSRWMLLVLALAAGSATMGFGGRIFSGLDSGRNADGISPITTAVAPMPSSAPRPSPRSTGHVGAVSRMPLGFAVQAAPPDRRWFGRLTIVGFLRGAAPLSARLLDPDGTTVASAVAATAAITTGGSVHLWAFEVSLEVPPNGRTAGPDARTLAVSWTDEGLPTTVCVIPMGRSGPGELVTVLSPDLYAACR